MNIGTLGIMSYCNKLNANKQKTGENITKFSSGKRINKAADDAAGATISEGFRAQVRGLAQGQKNGQDGVSLLQVADGALGEIGKQMQRMKEIAVEASNGTYTDEDRESIGQEFEELKKSIQNTVDGTEFNNIKLLDADKSLNIKVSDSPYKNYTLKLFDVSNSKTGIDISNVNTQNAAMDAIMQVDKANALVVDRRVKCGVDLNNLQHDVTNASNQEVNTTSSLSKIEDLDMAMSAMDFVKSKVISDYSQSILAGANQDVNSVMQFFK